MDVRPLEEEVSNLKEKFPDDKEQTFGDKVRQRPSALHKARCGRSDRPV